MTPTPAHPHLHLHLHVRPHLCSRTYTSPERTANTHTRTHNLYPYPSSQPTYTRAHTPHEQVQQYMLHFLEEGTHDEGDDGVGVVHTELDLEELQRRKDEEEAAADEDDEARSSA